MRIAIPTAASEPTANDDDASLRIDLTTLRDTAVVGLFALSVITALCFAQPIVVPVVAAIVVGSILAPLVGRLADRGVPAPITALVAVALLAGALYVLSIALAAPASRFIEDMPRALAQLRARLDGLDALRRSVADIQTAIAGSAKAATGEKAGRDVVETTVSIVTPAIGQLMIFLGSLLFFLWSRAGIRRHIVLAFTRREHRLAALRILNEIEADLAAYFVTITFINIGLAVVTGAGLALLGIENAWLWGAFAGVVNYIPYVGPTAVTVVLTIVGLTTQSTIVAGLAPAAMFVALATVEGHFLTPAIVGRRLAMNAFLVFLAVVFWTWLWGPIGAFLAVPLLIIAAVLARHALPSDDVQLP